MTSDAKRPKQNFTDLQLIVVEGGSTDRSTAIARGYVDHRSGRARAIGQVAGALECAKTARQISLRMKSDQSLNPVERRGGLGLPSPAAPKASFQQAWLDGPDYLADAECLL